MYLDTHVVMVCIVHLLGVKCTNNNYYCCSYSSLKMLKNLYEMQLLPEYLMIW